MPLTKSQVSEIHALDNEPLLKAYENILTEMFKVENFPSKKSLARLGEREQEIRKLILERMNVDEVESNRL